MAVDEGGGIESDVEYASHLQQGKTRYLKWLQEWQ